MGVMEREAESEVGAVEGGLQFLMDVKKVSSTQ